MFWEDCGVGKISQEEADEAIELALKYGLNMVDVAPTYGEAELRLSLCFQRYREKLFMAEKTTERTRNGAWRELNESLQRLGIAYFDLYQFHAVSSLDDLKLIFGENGAMEAFKEAKEVGLIRNVGITGHADMRVIIKALELFDFDSILIPVNVASMVYPDRVNDFRPLLKMAEDRDVGVIAIKAVSKGRWVGKRRYMTWYEPLDEQCDVDCAVCFTLSQFPVTAYALPCDVRLWPMVLDASERYKRLSEEEQGRFIDYARN